MPLDVWLSASPQDEISRPDEAAADTARQAGASRSTTVWGTVD
ncbi:hypothetical protein OG604_06505 [Streptomyces sp. NBC_01231]|nr:hypothetical protein OG604_06505 [Streptomyces sp. NBC_01231]